MSGQSFARYRAIAEIDTAAIRHNFCLLRAHAARGRSTPPRMIAVVKANAYGHGAALVVPALLQAGCDFFAVATAEEGEQVRALAPRADILVLGYTPPARVMQLLGAGLIQTVFSLDYARALSAAAAPTGMALRIHLKVDGGMHRLGFSPDDTAGLLAAAEQPCLAPTGLYTHFPAADTQKEATRCALSRFLACRRALLAKGVCLFAHAAASAALLALPETVLDGVRSGISLYGVSPIATSLPLAPAMTLSTSVVQVCRLPAGEPVGYGGTFVTPRDSQIGTIPLGYADGLDRRLSGFSVIWCGNGMRIPVPIVGRICMDQAMVDLTGLPARAGDPIEIFRDPRAIAERLSTIPYEVFTAISPRVERVFQRKDKERGML